MNTTAPIAIVIITRNEEKNLPYSLASVTPWARQVFVLDSGSTDRTREIAESFGAHFTFRKWDGYARQKNWGLENLPITTPWVLILDADEAVTPLLREEIVKIATADNCAEDGFYVNRYFVFLGRQIRHCGYFPSWNLRFFRKGKAVYEEREVHEHMVVEGRSAYLRHQLEHYERRGMEYYIAKHNQYSTLEAREMRLKMTGAGTASPGTLFSGGRVMRRRWIKDRVWPRLPARWLFRWLYMYILRLGFLDGVAGFHFCLFMAAYEHQITLKMKEAALGDEVPAAAGRGGGGMERGGEGETEGGMERGGERETVGGGDGETESGRVVQQAAKVGRVEGSVAGE